MALQKIDTFWAGYDKTGHVLVLVPTVLMLCLVAVLVGTGNEATTFFMDYRQTHPVLSIWMSAITNVVNPLFYLVYAWIFYKGFVQQNRRLMLLGISFCVAQLLISLLLVRIVKIAVGKPRPMNLLSGDTYSAFSLQHGNHSFPSGHTTEVTGSVLPLALRNKRNLLVICWGGVIALIAFSRIYLSMHHMADIVGGLIFGSITGFAIQYFCTWTKEK